MYVDTCRIFWGSKRYNNVLTYFITIIVILMSIAIPLAIAGGAIFIVSGIFKSGKKRAQYFQSCAAETGLTYIGAASVSSIQGAEYFRLFNLGNGYGRQIENAFKGVMNGVQVSVFDYTYFNTFGFGTSGKMPKQTVVMLESPRMNLPLFSLRPKNKGFFNKMGDALNEHINFPSDSIFTRKYLLYGHDEPRIKQIFDAQVLSYFDATEGINVEGGGSRLLFYRDSMIAAPNQLRWMLSEGLRIASLFKG